MPDDQIANLTYNETLAEAAIELCNSYNQGLFNVANRAKSALKTELIGHVAGLQRLKALLAQETIVV